MSTGLQGRRNKKFSEALVGSQFSLVYLKNAVLHPKNEGVEVRRGTELHLEVETVASIKFLDSPVAERLQAVRRILSNDIVEALNRNQSQTVRFSLVGKDLQSATPRMYVEVQSPILSELMALCPNHNLKTSVEFTDVFAVPGRYA